MSGGGIPDQGKNLGKAKVTLYVSSLENKGGNLGVGTGTVTMVLPLQDAHTCGQTL